MTDTDSTTTSGADHPDLFALLRGQVANAAVLAAEDHLGACATCSGELVSAVAGHALLTRTAKTLPDASQGSDRPSPTARHRPRRPAPAPPLVAAAAAAVLVAGVGLGAAVTRVIDGAEEQPRGRQDPTLSASLDPIEGDSGTGRDDRRRRPQRPDDGPHHGAAHRSARRLLLRVAPGPGHQQDAAPRPGRAGGTATFRSTPTSSPPTAQSTSASKPTTATPEHSVTSVLRGAYDLT